MSTKLPKESFVALAAVAWADGRMTPAEAQGLSHAARSLGIEGEDLAAVERATRERVRLEQFDASSLTAWERLLTFGLANWLSRLDGVQQAAELESLRELGRKMEHDEITDHRLRSAAAVAINIAMLPDGRRPDRYDFVAFETQLNERLPAIK
jgi:hypothetical protein